MVYNPRPSRHALCISATFENMAKQKQQASATVADPVCAPEWTDILRQMILIRRFEEATEREFRRGKIGGYLHVYIGQEAVASGIVSALRKPENSTGNIADAVEVLKKNGAEVVVGGEIAEGPGYAFQNTILRVSGEKFIENPHALQTEAFGAVSLMVFAKDVEQMKAVARNFEGNLTGCIYSDTGGSDDALYAQVELELRPKVGRLLNDKMPTGVAVTPAMNHGGPYPATGHPGFTAVGIPASLLRFGALNSYDNVRQDRLPLELRDRNPTGQMWRLIDRVWTQKDVGGQAPAGAHG